MPTIATLLQFAPVGASRLCVSDRRRLGHRCFRAVAAAPSVSADAVVVDVLLLGWVPSL